MSRTVHIIKLYQENIEFFSSLRKENIYNALLTMKYHNKVFREIIDDFNLKNNVTVGPLFHKGLSMPRLKILMALLAQEDNITICLKSPSSDYACRYNMKTTPKRFKEKFIPLLVNGFYLLGTVIEDSLTEDPSINCNNPFGFEHGDLGYWWAGIVILDWMKYFNVMYDKEKTPDCHTRCTDFYNDPSISRKYKYNQNSALSNMNRIPQQFLQEVDLVNFSKTIDKIDYDAVRLTCSLLQPLTEEARQVCVLIARSYGMTLEECKLKYQSDDTED